MKLYATTISDRATKGQGSNQELIIELKHETKRKEYAFFARLCFNIYEKENGDVHYRLYYQPENEHGYKENLKEIIITKR